jgi:Protein of unknown function (DUF3109)
LDLHEYMIDPAIVQMNFACDLTACKGACCTFPGGSGAPVLEEEIPILERAYEAVKEMLPPEHVALIEREGIIDGNAEETWIRCLNDEACVFVTYDGEIAKCAIQQAYYDGNFDWMKPKSCHLFPIRVSGAKRNVLRMESFSECEPAFIRGDLEEISLVEFLSEAVTRVFGKGFSEALRKKSKVV